MGEEGRIRERRAMTKQKAKRMSTENNDGMVDARRSYGTQPAEHRTQKCKERTMKKERGGVTYAALGRNDG